LFSSAFIRVHLSRAKPRDLRLNFLPHKINLATIWRQMEDVLFPALRLSTHERALYVHLLRHSRLDGRRTMRTSKTRLSRGLGVCPKTVRHYLRSLARTPCVEILERGEQGFLLEVRLPAEIVSVPCTRNEAEARVRRNEFKNRKVRRAIFRREKGRCFYCGKKLCEGGWGLDHVVPQALGGDNAATNAVACCHWCNCAKGEMEAADFLQALRRQGRLTAREWRERMKILSKRFATEALRMKTRYECRCGGPYLVEAVAVRPRALT
jgi:5-methylcytosine-specific restriction endonuclease McrA